MKIQQNTSVKGSIHILQENHIINPDRMTLFIMKSSMWLFHMTPKSGIYLFKRHQSLWSSFNNLIDGKVYVKQFTLVGGWSAWNLQSALQKFSYIKKKNINVKGQEGMYLPDTYSVSVGSSEDHLLRTMKTHMNMVVDYFWHTCAIPKTIKSKKQGVILASIVQKEAADNEDMPIIAKIFMNRLKIRMPLQSDVTVLYALYAGKPMKRPLTFKDLKINNKYNTYRFRGLPPTPISYPTKSALKSVFCNTDSSKKLFFVYDHDRVIHTSNTFYEHWRTSRLKINHES